MSAAPNRRADDHSACGGACRRKPSLKPFPDRDDFRIVSKEQLRSYARLRTLIDEWIDSGIELAHLERQARPLPQRKRASKSPVSRKSRAAGP
jgi:hypothetical protein